MPPSIVVSDESNTEPAVPPSILFVLTGSTKLNTPDPLVANTWVLLPSEFGKLIPVNTILPVPATAKFKSALLGADSVEPVADKSPRLVAAPPPPPPPVATEIPPAVDPSPNLKLPESTSTARSPSSSICVDKL